MNWTDGAQGNNETIAGSVMSENALDSPRWLPLSTAFETDCKGFIPNN